MKRYTLGINVPAHFRGDEVTAQIGEIASVGFDGFFTSWDPAYTEKWANAAARKGLLYQSIHAPFPPSTPTALLWQKSEAATRFTDILTECVRDCARHAIPIAVIHPVNGFPVPSLPTKQGLDNFARVVEVASKLGVTLAFENLQGEEYLAALLSAFASEPCVGFCFDTGHECCYGAGKDFAACYGEKMCHTHLNDNFGVMDPTLPYEKLYVNDLHLVMGDGVVDWQDLMARIDKTPYEGMLCCEVKPVNAFRHPILERYAQMPIEEFYAYVLERARAVRDRRLLQN